MAGTSKRRLKVGKDARRTRRLPYRLLFSSAGGRKAIKALLYAMGETIVLGHSVNVLARKAAQYDEKIGEKCEKWSVLDGYYIPTRYPNGLPDGIPAKVYNREIATKAVELAEDAVSTVEEIINDLGTF